MKIKNIMPTTWLLISIILMAVIHFLFPGTMIIPHHWNLVGIIPMVFGVIINLMADKAFHKANTTVKPFEESSSLITSGVFQISRNPMYLGFVIILIGIALLLRSLTPYLVVVAFVVLMDRAYIKTEERMMAEEFGADWETYKQGTRRWI